MRIVLASANPDKLRELRSILSELGLEVVPVSDVAPGWHVEETGATLEENALLKARAAASATGLPAVADDTGLCVRALGGGPGVYSSRFAGESATYSQNVCKLLSRLIGETPEMRRACFRTAAAIALPDGTSETVSGRAEGRITEAPMGKGGFGYDPVFLSDDLGRTYAEATPEQKDLVSHRGRAFRNLLPLIRRLVLHDEEQGS
ncbi:RdgB/HAM1 family non-canonical purine NTP pyrophosphatase [Candidatus Fermentibacterales bacterium]|nr:RdgB/HAM1 family non-canonical purine NTP pyrophosphatase [Candidatus Fermentibacterales bacterium]